VDKIVVDSSVVIKWFVTEQYSAESYRVLDGYQQGELTLLAPDLLNAEIGNIVWKKYNFQGLAETDAQLIITAFQMLKLSLIPTAALLTDAYRLAITHRRTVYDMLYLALSLREQCLFITADERLVNAVNPAFPNVISVVDWP